MHRLLFLNTISRLHSAVMLSSIGYRFFVAILDGFGESIKGCISTPTNRYTLSTNKKEISLNLDVSIVKAMFLLIYFLRNSLHHFPALIFNQKAAKANNREIRASQQLELKTS
jgi:hypothetical protein